MITIENKSTEQLHFISADCLEAVSAYPQGHKAQEYLDTYHACKKEIADRENLRLWRKTLKEHTRKDILTISRNSFERRKNNAREVYKRIYGEKASAYAIDRVRSALFMLGWYRLYTQKRWLNN